MLTEKEIIARVLPYHCLWDPATELPALFEAFEKTPASSFLEIGTFKGATTAAMALRFPEAKIFTLDLPAPEFSKFNPQPRHLTGIAYRDLHLLELGRITEVRLNSSDLGKLEGTFDLIFIDGDHTFNQALSDIRLSQGKLNLGGVLVVHDYAEPGDELYQAYCVDVHRAVESFLAESDWSRQRLAGSLVQLSPPAVDAVDADI